ncbi:MAG: acetylglutamate kinase [Bacteroidota bacterium]
MKSITVVKVGGAVTEDPFKQDQLLESFSAIDGLKLLVHGGGRHATELAAKLGLETKMIEGRRITSPAMLEVAVMSYAGWINKTLVAKLQAKTIDAVGLSCVDANIITAMKRRVENEIDFGSVGDPIEVNPSFLLALLNTELVPVLAPITHDGKGDLLNTNADTIASLVSSSLSKYFHVKLTFAFEQQGVLKKHQKSEEVYNHLDFQKFQMLIQNGTVHDGMIPKLQNGFNALKQGVQKVYITRYDRLDTKQNEVFGTQLI